MGASESGMDRREEMDRRMAFFYELMMRSERHSHHDRYGRDSHMPAFIHRMEKLKQEYRRGEISREEYKRQKDMFKEYMMRKSRHYEEFGMMFEEIFHGESSESSDEDEERTEEKFAELEEAHRKWYRELDQNKQSTVYGTMNMVSNMIILQNDYNVDRIVEISSDLKEPVFLTKMAYYAVKNDTASCLKALIKHGAWVNQPNGYDDNNFTPLHLACKKNNKACVEVLISAKAKVDKLDDNGNSSLLIAMHSGCGVEIIKLLLRRCKSSFLTHVNKHGENLLHCCGPWFNTDEDKKQTRRENKEAYEMILQKAREKGELQQLLEMRDNERGYTPLLDAVTADSPGNLQLLIDHGAEVEVVAVKSPDRKTPMHIAAEKGSAECLKLLLGAGAPVNVCNAMGEPPIVCAYKNFNFKTILEVTEVLLEHGARVHEALLERENWTVFHKAALEGYDELVDLFLMFGAHPLIADRLGRRPIDFQQYPEMHDRLEEESTRLRSLSEICKWKLRESIMSGASIQKTVKSLPIPKHLQTYLETRGYEKPRFQFTEEDPGGTKSEEQAEESKEEESKDEEFKEESREESGEEESGEEESGEEESKEEAAVSGKDPSADLA